MAYYIISFEPGPMKEFQKRIPFLDDATWIRDKKNLNEVKSLSGDPFFFVHLTPGDREAMDEMVLIIRDMMSAAKIIYATEDLKAQKSHQLTPVGGDAYVPLNIEPNKLMSLIEGLVPPDLNQHGNRLEERIGGSVQISAHQGLEEFKNHPKSKQIDQIFAQVYGNKNAKKPLYQSAATLVSMPIPDEFDTEELDAAAGEDMSDKDQELSLDDLGDLELGGDSDAEIAPPEEEGLDLDLGDDAGLDLSAPDEIPEDSGLEDSGMDLDLDDGLSLDDSDTSAPEELPEEDLGFSLDDDSSDAPSLDFSVEEEAAEDDVSLDLGGDDDAGLSLGGEDDDLGLSLGGDDDSGDALSLGGDDDDLSLDLSADDSADIDLSDDAKEKLKEIDAIMDLDASQVGISMDLGGSSEADDDGGLSLGGDDDNLLSLGAEEESTSDSDLETSLVGDDLDLGSINFSSDEAEEEPVKEDKSKKKTKEVKEARESRETAAYDGNIGKELKEISGAYSGEMERMQATLSNLRTDREELLAKISRLEEDKVIQNRQSLTMRAELDEKKIELSIIRKKLNDEITELKDRMKLHDEKRLILEEKNKILLVELDKAGQKNKIDVKKVQMRERELEQKLELLKADSETQIRHRDLKILELKRKLDAMEFDMESISVQEKKSVESRFELEDKLDKAIKTLRNAISVLEDESDNKSGALAALKKNIDM